MCIFSHINSRRMKLFEPCLYLMIRHLVNNATLWQNQQNGCSPSEHSDQSRHPPSLSECSLYAEMDPSLLYADSEDSDQTGRMPRLIWVFAGRTCHFVGFVMRWLKWAMLCENVPLMHMWTAKDQTSLCMSAVGSGLEVIKLFSCSTQLSMKFVLLINLKLLRNNRKFFLA